MITGKIDTHLPVYLAVICIAYGKHDCVVFDHVSQSAVQGRRPTVKLGWMLSCHPPYPSVLWKVLVALPTLY